MKHIFTELIQKYDQTLRSESSTLNVSCGLRSTVRNFMKIIMISKSHTLFLFEYLAMIIIYL